MKEGKIHIVYFPCYAIDENYRLEKHEKDQKIFEISLSID